MISIIINSYDGYSDCWVPFCKLLKKYFPESENFEILLSTTNKIYEFDSLGLKTITHGNDAPWSKRLRQTLEQAKYDVVLPISEDYFLKSKVNFEKFKYFVDLMYENNEIDHIRLLRYRVRWKSNPSQFEYLEKINPITKHRFLYIPSLWKKKTLLKYLHDYEGAFMAEKMSGYRSWIRKDGFYSITEKYVERYGQVYDTFNSGFIFKGKWVSWGIKFLDDENFKIDFTKRGILTKEFMKRTRLQSKINIFKSPTLSIKSFGSVIILFFKSLFIKL